MNTGEGFTALTAAGMVYLHARPENFIYYAFLLPYFLKGFKKDPRLLGLLTANTVVKVLEYWRGASFTPEWRLEVSRRLVVIQKYFLENIGFLFNPLTFNVLFSALLVVGTLELLKNRKVSIAILPIISYLIYTTKAPYTRFYGWYIPQRFLLSFAVTCIPAIFAALKRVRLPKALLIIPIIPLLVGTPETGEQQLYDLAKMHVREIAETSNNLSMPIYSPFPYIFSDSSDSVFVMDDFPYPDGSYLALGKEGWQHTPEGANCSMTEIIRLNKLILYNMTCKKQ